MTENLHSEVGQYLIRKRQFKKELVSAAIDEAKM